MKITILDLGVAEYPEVERVIRDVLSEMDINADITVLTDITDVARFPITAFPAVIIDGEVKCTGNIPRKDDVQKWFTEDYCG